MHWDCLWTFLLNHHSVQLINVLHPQKTGAIWAQDILWFPSSLENNQPDQLQDTEHTAALERSQNVNVDKVTGGSGNTEECMWVMNWNFQKRLNLVGVSLKSICRCCSVVERESCVLFLSLSPYRSNLHSSEGLIKKTSFDCIVHFDKKMPSPWMMPLISRASDLSCSSVQQGKKKTAVFVFLVRPDDKRWTNEYDRVCGGKRHLY